MGPSERYTERPSGYGQDRTASYNPMSRSGRSFGMTQNYISRATGQSRRQSEMATGMTQYGPTETQGWEPTGNIIEIDEAELAELHRMIENLNVRIEEAGYHPRERHPEVHHQELSHRAREHR